MVAFSEECAAGPACIGQGCPSPSEAYYMSQKGTAVQDRKCTVCADPGDNTTTRVNQEECEARFASSGDAGICSRDKLRDAVESHPDIKQMLPSFSSTGTK